MTSNIGFGRIKLGDIMYDIIIVGAGPAGMTAGIYAKRANKNVLILEAKNYGGQIVNTHNIDNFPTQPHINGFDFASKLYNQTIELGAKIVFERVVEINNYEEQKRVVTNKNTYNCKSLIIATGSDNRKLGIELENELTGKGVSYCATCDGTFYKGMDVAVVGFGTHAIEDAIYLSDIVNKVYLINKKDKFDDENNLISVLKDNVKVMYNSKITKLIGNDKLEKIEINDNALIEVSGLFIDVGRIPETENFKKMVNTNENGYIMAGEDCHTNVEGIFVAGDTRTKTIRQLTTAVSDGTVAAIEAIKYINNLKEE